MPLNDFLDRYREAMNGSGEAAPSGIDIQSIQKNVDARLQREQVDQQKGYEQAMRDAKTRQKQSLTESGYEVIHDPNTGEAKARQAKRADGSMENVRRKLGTDIYTGENSGDLYQP